MVTEEPITRAFDAAIFDMDGVVTRTARLHAAAWKALFDDFLQRWAQAHGEPYRAFEGESDYRAYVDGKPRRAGIRAFLAARGIELPEGTAADPPDALTIEALAQRKNALFEARLDAEGVAVYESTVALISALRAVGVRTAVVTSSRHGRRIIDSAHLGHLFDARIDGVDAEALGLRGKPDPDAFLAAAQRLHIDPARTIVVEDATAGVEAARRGGFGLVVGIDRGGNREALAAHGADRVVSDLAELGVEDIEGAMRSRPEGASGYDAAWAVEQEGYEAAREHEVESLFTVGNGYLGVRGAPDALLPGSHGDLFVAGVYDRKQPELPYSELEFLDPAHGDYAYREIASLPFPFRVRLAVNGKALDLARAPWRRHRRRLDLKRALLCAVTQYETPGGELTEVQAQRCASACDPHLLLQEVRVRLENHSATLDIDFSLEDPDLGANHPHLVALSPRHDDAHLDVRRYRTRSSDIEVCIAARVVLPGGNGEGGTHRVTGGIGETIAFRRYVAVYSTRDVADPEAAAVRQVRNLRWGDYDAHLDRHAGQWNAYWQRADVRVPGRPATEQALRFGAYHLGIAAGRDPRISVTARALSGRAYEGHIFWDVEIFMLPFYLHTQPELARTLLGYRHHTLAGARRHAAELGYRGACYAWESTVTGDDTTPRSILLKSKGTTIPIYTGFQQIHVTADVVYGLWRYWEATRDAEFMQAQGAEILVETARFWASRCVPDGSTLHLRGVVGPDEYHHSVDDNAYTNHLAAFNLERAAWAAQWLAREHARAWQAVADRCSIAGDEPAHWGDTAARLFRPQPDSRGVIEQFAGFFDLERYPLSPAERFKAPVSRLFEWDKVNRAQLIKQADVLMLLHLFPDAYPQEVLAANYRYYEPITDHGSSLSPAIHAVVAARLGLSEDAERYWRQSLWLDLSNTMSNSVLGVHPACMGGTWQALVYGFLGVRETGGTLEAHPDAASRLPHDWREVSLALEYRGRTFPIQVTREGAPS